MKYKYLLSFLKSKWEFEDYPLETWKNPNAEQDEIKYGAGFTNWMLFVAHGKSFSEAVQNLKDKFIEYAKEYELPRPGIKVPIQFAESDRVDLNEEIAVDFFNKIIGLNYYDCFISDQTSLGHFGLDIEEAVDKIKNEYGIEPKGELFLSDIFEQIKNKDSE